MSNLKPLILHAHGTGPNPYKVAIYLEALGIPYEVKLWQFGDDAKNGVKSDKFTAINPNGRVPALEDPNTGVTSWESGAVLNYILRVYDTKGKYGPVQGPGGSEQERVDADKWIFFLVSTLGPFMGQVNWFRHYHSSKNDDALARYEAQSYRALGVLDAHLGKSKSGYVLDRGFSYVDMHFYPWVKIYGFAGLDIANYPKVKAYIDKVQGLKEVQAAYEKVPAGEVL